MEELAEGIQQQVVLYYKAMEVIANLWFNYLNHLVNLMIFNKIVL